MPGLPLCCTRLCFLPGIHLAPDLTSDTRSVQLLLSEHSSLALSPATNCCLLLQLGRAYYGLSSQPLSVVLTWSDYISSGKLLCGARLCLPWPCLAFVLRGGLYYPHLSSRDSLYLSQPTPKGQPLLFLFWICGSLIILQPYPSCLGSNTPWGLLGKFHTPIWHLFLVADRPELLKEHRQDDLDSETIGTVVEPLYVEVACKAELKKWLLFFLLLVMNPCTLGQTQLGRLTPR